MVRSDKVMYHQMYHKCVGVNLSCFHLLQKSKKMRQESRLPRVLYALLHLDRMQAPATSELIAQMLGTNALVVRRTMGGLRRAGIVFSGEGPRRGMVAREGGAGRRPLWHHARSRSLDHKT